MHRPIVTVALLFWSMLLAPSCEHQRPLAPDSIGTVEQLLQALSARGLRVTVAGEFPPGAHPYFSVPGRDVLINDSHASVFEYPSAEDAAADAALMREPARSVLITWISTPRFYRQVRIIVLYVGCAIEIVRALGATLGPPFLIGNTPCELSR